MKIRVSLLNLLFLLMFWGPYLLYLFVRTAAWISTNKGKLIYDVKYALTHVSSLDDYLIHSLSAMIVSLLFFVLLSVIYTFYDFWARIGYWLRYVSLLGFFVLNWILVCCTALLLVNLLGISSSCPGGSPLLFLYLLFFVYAIIGFVWTLIVSIRKSRPF